MSERVLTIDGLCNVRDLGGLRTGEGRTVRSRAVLRGDVPRWLTPEGVVQLGSIGTVLDLRGDDEVHHDGRGPLEDHGAVRHHVPFGHVEPNDPRGPRPELDDWPAIYAFLLDRGAGSVIAGLELVAEAPLPLYVHCTAGKDRTGVFVTVLLSLLGVPEDEIAADYMLTEQALAEIVRRGSDLPSSAHENDPHPLGGSIDISLVHAVLGALSRAGGAVAWLDSWGAAPDLGQRVRARLLED